MPFQPRPCGMTDGTDASVPCRYDVSNAYPTAQFAAVAFLDPECCAVGIQVEVVNVALHLEAIGTAVSKHFAFSFMGL
jgi:hypothetical protein